MKLNNKGFTLIELLGVIVILMAILYLAIPSLTSSVENAFKNAYVLKVRGASAVSKLVVPVKLEKDSYYTTSEPPS